MDKTYNLQDIEEIIEDAITRYKAEEFKNDDAQLICKMACRFIPELALQILTEIEKEGGNARLAR